MATVASRKQANTDRRVPSRRFKDNRKKDKIRVVELFAGVGGFRKGFERASNAFETVWFNQWEPGESDKAQYAWRAYCKAFREDELLARFKMTNQDIAKVPISGIPDHDLLVGGFPCQDYSVARTLSHAAGLVGKKGVLWWEIYRILRDKGGNAPSFLMLENVDRLLKSPVAERGRDFAIMLASLAELGYAVEWRVINAADYGMPQRRRRIYILGYKKGTFQNQTLGASPKDWLMDTGIMPAAFPIDDTGSSPDEFELGPAHEIAGNFNKGAKLSRFHNAGVMIDGIVHTARVGAKHSGKKTTLGEILIREDQVPEGYFISKKHLPLWRELKGAKKEKRTSKSGFEYEYSEGPIAFPDHLDKPSRTIVTGEGGSSPSRFKHVIKTSSGKFRRLMPEELERLNMFDVGHTEADGISDARRAFFMGNALVVGIVERLGKELLKRAY